MLYKKCYKSTVGEVQMINTCAAKFILGNMKIYLYFLSFLKTEMPQVVKFPPCGSQRFIYPT